MTYKLPLAAELIDLIVEFMNRNSIKEIGQPRQIRIILVI